MLINEIFMTGTVMWHREIHGLNSRRFGKWIHGMWHKVSLAQEDKRGTGLGIEDPTTLNSSV